MRKRFLYRHALPFVLLLSVPFIMAPGRCGTSAGGFFSDLPAPDMRGTWAVTYDDQVSVEIDLGGGAGHTGTVSANGGAFSFLVDGQQVELNVDCSLDWVVCPSEVWTEQVDFDQPRFAEKPHQVNMSIQEQSCSAPRMPDEAAGECSSIEEDNLPCDEEICDEENVETTSVDRLASISDPVPANPDAGSKPDYTIGIALAGGFAVPAANCLLLGASYADADIEYDGSYDPEENTMEATGLVNGLVTIELAGACFWGAYVGDDLAGALLGARVKLQTGFTATKQ
jgi:hypothetical protein